MAEPKKVFSPAAQDAHWEPVEVEIAEAIHAEVCTAYTHEGRNAQCHRSAKAAVKVLRERAARALREALGVPAGLSKDSTAD